MTIELRRSTWLDWLKRIENDVRRLLMDRYIFQETMEIVKANPATHDPNDFVDWFIRQYIHVATIRVRQQIDRRSDSVSLYRLLADLRQQATLITRDWYVGCWPEPPRSNGAASCSFDDWFGQSQSHADPAVFESDLNRLENICRPLKVYANKRLAHQSNIEDRKLAIPTWGDLDSAIDHLDRVVCRYIGLLRLDVCSTLLPTWQYNWQRVFAKPWLPQSLEGEHVPRPH